jgi:hypothetical protein
MNYPEQRTPALEFLRQVQVWQQSPGGTAGIAVAMPGGEERTLTQLLDSFARDAANPGHLEQRARMWLVGYREMNPPLTQAQRARLDDVIDRQAWYAEDVRERGPASALSSFPLRRAMAVFALIIAMCVLVIAIQRVTAVRHDDTPPPAGVSQPQKQLPAGLTDLQRFRADWNAPAAAADDAGAPGQVVLLQDQLYYQLPWSVLAGDPGWQPDTSGSLTAQIQGSAAVITDSNGVTWNVATGQPFALSSNLQFVFRVLRDGTIQSMPQAHAIAARFRFGTTNQTGNQQ